MPTTLTRVEWALLEVMAVGECVSADFLPSLANVRAEFCLLPRMPDENAVPGAPVRYLKFCRAHSRFRMEDGTARLEPSWIRTA